MINLSIRESVIEFCNKKWGICDYNEPYETSIKHCCDGTKGHEGPCFCGFCGRMKREEKQDATGNVS